MKVKVTDLENKDAGEIELSDSVFGVAVRSDLLHRAVRWQLAKRQAGTHSTKTVGEISGTTRKPWNQKGSGRARASSLRSPQFRGGAVIFGPTPRSHAHKLPKKVRRLALLSALSSKQAEGKLHVLDSASMKDGKTAALARHLTKLKMTSTVLLIDGPEIDKNLAFAARNLVGFDVLPQQGANVYDILRRDILVLTRAAIEHLEARLT
ncbi:MAG: 50S ribosomal protein L4 [Proteobacteria bacterium]|nr:50S ribosomal protein L4 [Pseudomonadota bacterium]MDA1355094.1 50S ribosomal protein L4 [Pseudomonadota bacterium]